MTALRRSARGRRTYVTVLSAVSAVTAVLALSGCGIRSTAVPVDAGLPASRTACPPTPGTTVPAAPTGPAALASAEASYLYPPLPSTTPWEQLSSAVAEPWPSVRSSDHGGSAEPKPSAPPAPAATRAPTTPIPVAGSTSPASASGCLGEPAPTASAR